LRLHSLPFQTLTPLHASPSKPLLHFVPRLSQPSFCRVSLSLTLTSLHVYFPDPHFVACLFSDPHSTMRPMTSLSLPWLMRDLPTLVSTASHFPYLDQTSHEKFTSSSLIHVYHLSLLVALLSCTLHFPMPLCLLLCCAFLLLVVVSNNKKHIVIFKKIIN